MSARWPAEELDPDPTRGLRPADAAVPGPPPAPPGEIQPANIEHLESTMESQPAVARLVQCGVRRPRPTFLLRERFAPPAHAGGAIFL